MGILLGAGLTGSLLVYQKELVSQVVTPGAQLPPGYGAEQLGRQLAAIVGHGNDQLVVDLKAPSVLEPYWTLRQGHSLELLALDTLEPYREGVWFLRLMEFVRELHVDLLSAEWGETVLLVSGVLTLFLCVSGLILWWPTRRGFRWSWVLPRRIRVSQWLQYHRHSGAIAAPILLLVMLTGSMMLWQKLVRPILPKAPLHSVSSDSLSIGTLGISEGFRQAQAVVPDGWPTFIRVWPEQGERWLKVRFRLPGEWHLNGRTAVQINLSRGELLMSERADQMAPGRRLLNQLYPLHAGYGINGIYKLLVCLSGAALVWLSLTGGLHYFRRRMKRRRRDVSREVTGYAN